MNIKKKSIIFSIVLISTSIMLIMSIYIYKYKETSVNLIKENIISSAEGESNHLENFFNQRLINLKAISDMPITKDVLDMSNNTLYNKEYEYKKNILIEMLQSMQKQQDYLVKISLISKDNNIIASSNNIKMSNNITSEELIKLKNKEIVITDIIQDSNINNGEKSVIIIVPIMMNNEYKGSLESIVNMNYFEKLIKEFKFFNTGKITIMDRKGNVAAKNSEYVNENIYDINVDNNLESTLEKIDFNKNSSGTIEYNINGINKIGYFYKIKNTNWIVLSSVQWNEFMNPLKDNIKIIILVTIIISIIIGIIYILIMNFFSKPIYQLLKSIREIKKGNYKSRFIYNIKDEFGEISQAFNELMDEILSNKMKLKLSEECYKVLMEQTYDVIFEWDLINDSINYSDNWNEKFNYKPILKEKNLNIISIIYKDDRKRFIKVVNEIKTTNEFREFELRLRKNYNGEYIWCKFRINVIVDGNNNPIKVIGVITDIDHQKREIEKLLFKAERDSLTEIYNKITSQEMISTYIKNSKIEDRHALFIIDIDDFKSINDNLGHMVGDLVLKDISQKLTKIFNENSIVGRIGGDEFIVFLKHIQSEEDIYKKAEELIESFKVCYTKIYNKHKVSGSIGVSIYPNDGLNFEELFSNADKALYLAKEKGKDTYHISDV